MRYLHVRWLHNFDEEPVDLYSEIDAEGWEVRKVEFFRNGHVDLAGNGHHTGRTALGLDKVPSIEEIATDPVFLTRSISLREFEEKWSLAMRSHDL